MLYDFKFSFDEFACGRRGINKKLLDNLLILHCTDFGLYFTGSRYLNSIHVNWKTDYDFFFCRDNQDLRHLDTFLNASGLFRSYDYFNENLRWVSRDTPPKVDVFALNEREFATYKNANETIKSMPDAPFHSRPERIRLFNELCGPEYVRGLFRRQTVRPAVQIPPYRFIGS